MAGFEKTFDKTTLKSMVLRPGDKFAMDLQHFAEGDTPPPPAPGTTPPAGAPPSDPPAQGAGTPPPAGQPKPGEGLTMAQVEAIIDRRVSKHQAENEELKAKLDKLTKEKMTEDERKAYEMEQAKRELADGRAALEREKLANATLTKLTAEKLDPKWAPFLSGSTTETLPENVSTIKKLIEEEVNRGIEARLKAAGGTPPAGAGAPATGQLTEAQAAALSPAELEKALKEGRLNNVLKGTT